MKTTVSDVWSGIKKQAIALHNNNGGYMNFWGNTNLGSGTKNLFKNITYLRGRNGARIFYRTINEGYEILAKANKDNEQTVIKI